LSKSKKHILLLSSWYPSRVSPFLGNFIQRFAQLIATKYQVSVIYTIADESISEFEIVDTSNGNLREIMVYHPKGRTFFQKLLYQIMAFNKAAKKVEQVDIIHANVIYTKGIQFLLAKRKYKKPLLLLEHASYFREEKRISRSIYEKLILFLIKRKIDRIAVVSELLKSDLEKDFPGFEISIISNCIDLELYKPSNNNANFKNIIVPTQFIHISTLDEAVKDPKGILDACKVLVNGGQTNFHLTIISDEPYSKWETYLYSKQITEYVTFKGPLEWNELVPYYQNADAFILFSKYETFSIVLAEAWACGLPVITTPVGIAKDLKPELGYQVEIGNPESLAKGMYKMMNNKGKFNSTVIRNHAKLFSKEHVLKTYKQLIDSMI
jgi:glycosyltransferase involved in cell wall biosynthesis